MKLLHVHIMLFFIASFHNGAASQSADQSIEQRISEAERYEFRGNFTAAIERYQAIEKGHELS